MAATGSPWGEVRLEPGGGHRVVIASLTLELERAGEELWLRHRHARPEGELRGAGGRDEEPEWTRWAVKPGSPVHLVPAVPERPVVVAHERPFNLPPRGEARVYVRIPLHVQVRVGSGRGEFVALDVPTVVLSDTWWGGFTGGELAYWMKTKARSRVERELFAPHLAMCPFQLTNASAEALPLGRFAVRVPHLTLFEGERGVWSDEVRVVYEGAEEGSEIGFGGRAPAEAPDARRIVAPRQAPQKGFRAITFDRLISMSNLGF